MSNDIWVLGATGRTGRGIARRLHETGHPVVLAGRDHGRLAALAAELGDVPVVTGTYDELLAQLRPAAPAVVVNTIGPFARTSAAAIEACPPGTHYVDLGNELAGVTAALDGHERAVAAGSTVVVGGGFGVLATEAVLLHVLTDHPTPTRVRVDAIPSLAMEGGVMGEALAGSILGGTPDGGRRVDRGRLVRFPVTGARRELTTPSGDPATTSALPTGDLVAAWRASGADAVVSATSAIPSGPAMRVLFPVLGVVLRVPSLRRTAIRRLARVALPERERATEFSWGHAEVEWADGTIRHGWLRLGDAQHFTEMVAAEVARRLAAQTAAPGAYTPGALFGAALATDLGGVFVA